MHVLSRTILPGMLFAGLLLGCVTMPAPAIGEAEHYRAEEGVLDLRGRSFTEEGLLTLRGEWEIYPLALPDPEKLPPPAGNGKSEAAAAGEGLKRHYVRVPGRWAAASGSALEGSSFGYATYRLVILLDEEAPRRLGLYFDAVGTAYEAYLNGRRLTGAGTVGTDRSESVPRLRKHVTTFQSRQERLELVIKVSNYHDVAGGIHYPLFLGTVEQAYAKRYGKLMLDLFIFGSLLIMALYHFGLYLHRRKDPSPLYFGLLTLMLAVRVIFHNGTYILMLLPDFPWALELTIAYLTFTLPPMLFYRFITAFFPGYLPGWTRRVSDGLSLLFSAAVIALPAWIYTRYIIIIILYVAVLIAAILYILVRALRDRRSGSLLFAAGFFLFTLFVTHDVVKQLWGTSTMFMVPIGLLVFIFFQSLVMTRRFAGAFADSERLSAYLMKLNNSMERFVPREFLTYLGKESVMDVQLGDHASRTMTVLFADLRGFTQLSEQMSPEETFRFINSFLRRMGPIIRAHRGFVDKYIGDGIMALFSAQPGDAADAALALRRELVAYNRDRAKAGYDPIDFGIGIHTGELMLGTIGENKRMDGTVISDAVNLASRIEELTREHEVGIAVSEAIYTELQGEDRFLIRFIGRDRVKGKREPVAVYELTEHPR